MLYLLANSNHANLVQVRFLAHVFATWIHGRHPVHLIGLAIKLIDMQLLQLIWVFQNHLQIEDNFERDSKTILYSSMEFQP